MSPDEKAEFIEGLGIGQSGLDRLITACYRLLGLISFLTAGEDECRAWTIVNGTKAPQAAGKIHTDFEKGFIRAEIVPFDTLVELGSMAACKEKGLVRSEGKDYVMKDGDIVLFRFNVCSCLILQARKGHQHEPSFVFLQASVQDGLESHVENRRAAA